MKKHVIAAIFCIASMFYGIFENNIWFLAMGSGVMYMIWIVDQIRNWNK